MCYSRTLALDNAAKSCWPAFQSANDLTLEKGNQLTLDKGNKLTFETGPQSLPALFQLPGPDARPSHRGNSSPSSGLLGVLSARMGLQLCNWKAISPVCQKKGNWLYCCLLLEPELSLFPVIKPHMSLCRCKFDSFQSFWTANQFCGAGMSEVISQGMARAPTSKSVRAVSWQPLAAC